MKALPKNYYAVLANEVKQSRTEFFSKSELDCFAKARKDKKQFFVPCKIMKGLLFAFILCNPAILSAQILDTPHFKIVINCLSTEYEVVCAKVSYEGTNKETGGTIRLIGTQLMKTCEDGATPCQSLGYEFTNGAITYFVSEDGHLQVTDGAKVLVDELGTWTF